MLKDNLRKLLEEVAKGGLDVESALQELSRLPFTDLGFAKVDHHRELRHGIPEVVLCEGKLPSHVLSIVRTLKKEHGENILLTRIPPEIAGLVREEHPDALYHPEARVMVIGHREPQEAVGHVVIASGGSADFGVAEEARITAELMGARVTPLYDIGVAGVHRLFSYREIWESARVIVVVAGMEGALASLVAGVANCPVIGVPTSTGYGASFGGLAALLGMLNSCAAGVAVVNIDNGFGAGFIAALINRKAKESG
jgi:hypothetical protein